MEFDVRLYQGENFMWVAECPDIPGCMCHGLTEDEAMQRLEETIKDAFKVRAELGLPPFVQHRVIHVA